MKKVLLVFYSFVILFLLCAQLFAGEQGSNDYAFFKANEMYAQGDYEQAIAEYEKILSRGFESGNLYFNIGNCYFKLGDLGRAILNYERAKRLIPRDGDLLSNYSFAIAETNVSSVDVKQNFFMRIVDGFSSCFSLREITFICSGLVILFFLFLLFFVLKIGRYKLIIFCFVCVCFLFLLFATALMSKMLLIDGEAVVVDKEEDVHFAPVKNSIVHFTAYEGMKFRVLQAKNEWTKIKRQDGKKGWIGSSSIEVI